MGIARRICYNTGMEKKLTICLLNDSFPPIIDGVSNAVLNYARIIEKNHGHSLVVTPHMPGEDDSSYDFPVVRYPSIDTRKLIGYVAGYPFSPEAAHEVEEQQVSLLHAHCPIASTLVFVIQQLVVLALSPDSASIMDGVFIGFIFAFSIMAGIMVIRKTKAAALRFLSLLVTSTCMITLGVPYAFVPVPAVKLVIGVTAAILSILFAFLSMRSVVKSSKEDYYDEKKRKNVDQRHKADEVLAGFQA